MPYCWDGHDNAQRAEAVGVGRRINRAAWSAQSLRADILSVLGDDAMRSRLAGISANMQRNPGTVRAASAILAAIAPARTSSDGALKDHARPSPVGSP